jgi:ligand-binding SRPBCC domain-containing protein
MHEYQASVVLPRIREEAFEHLRRTANLLKMFPAGTASNLSIKVPEIMNVGEVVDFKVKALGGHYQFVHEIKEVVAPEKIVLVQIEGPFKAWTQELHFQDSENQNTLMTSIVRFAPPGGMLGFVVTPKLVISQLKEWVGRGHELIRQDLMNQSMG